MVTLYLGHAQTGAPMVQYDYPADYLTLFSNYPPQQIPAATDEIHEVRGDKIDDKNYKKHYQLLGAIGGKMRPRSRHSNENTLGRDILPLDFDSINDEAAFLNRIQSKLTRVGMGYVLYKTFSYRPDNIRYRLLIPLDRMITRPEEYKAIMQVLARMLGTELDEFSTHWGQIFFMPVQTENNAEDLIRVVQGYPLVVDSWLEKILTIPDYQSIKSEMIAPPKVAYEPPKHEKPLGFALDRIAAGKAQRGDYEMVGKFFTNIGMSRGEIERWYEYFDGLQIYSNRIRRFSPNDPTVIYPKKRKSWAIMFRDIIDGLGDHEGRNNTMFNFASFLLDERVKSETLERFVTDANYRNQPPMGEEFLTTISSAIKRKVREDHRRS